jgi:Ca2+-binding EF-hand superfamily protein
MRNHIDEPQLILRTTLGMNFPLREIYRIVRAMDGEDTIHSNQFIDF